ncbi:unnamed protein product [Didymodactylos carnosus]|uniref:Uncharacterized protein n=1 Tax=Didymodactylos carnosus TaxID=1234261 RepID=A0A814VQE3_9BILA|nr:unnamed protein product [Didymodactylos carnosus]CAF1188569.1 unnamed protein product [Didymodactylos carnosus]CAF3830702.1 unnamed protein product [Didymodactylos carnosus]CAF3952824.1 unnamed protein product [Didymodactylos carnosus]
MDEDGLFADLAQSVRDELEPSLHTVSCRSGRQKQKHITVQNITLTDERPSDTATGNDDTRSDSSQQSDKEFGVNNDIWTQLHNELIGERDAVDDLDTPLFPGAAVNVRQYHKNILEFCNNVRLEEANVTKLLKLIELALPVPHQSMTTSTKLVDLFREKSAFKETVRYSICFATIDENTKCTTGCRQNQYKRESNNIIEHVTCSDDTELIRTIRRNKDLIKTYPRKVAQLLPNDILTRAIYQQKLVDNNCLIPGRYPVSLMIHIDGAPLVRWAKKQTWPVMAAVCEIPPPLRENQTNIILLALWNGPVKPDIDTLLLDITTTLRRTIIIDNDEYVIDVQLFKADGPARSFGLKHNLHNGYHACVECDQQGVRDPNANIMLYPHNQKPANLRTPELIKICAELAVKERKVNVLGVQGISPLSHVLLIPYQIDIDVMHLCFIGHASTLLERWEKMVNNDAWQNGTNLLQEIRWPHNSDVELSSLSERSYWKAHDYRSFFLRNNIKFSRTNSHFSWEKDEVIQEQQRFLYEEPSSSRGQTSISSGKT